MAEYQPITWTELVPITAANLDTMEGGILELRGLRQIVTFTTSGTFSKGDYPWLRAVRVRLVGGGGGGAGAASTSAGEVSFGDGGGGGCYAESLLAVASLGASETVTVGPAGPGNFGDGGNSATPTSFGALVSAAGGSGGSARTATTTLLRAVSPSPTARVGGNTGTGQVIVPGSSGASGISLGVAATQVRGGDGGSSLFGGGRPAGSGGLTPPTSQGRGAGGAGAANHESQAALQGAAGTAGLVVVELYA